MYTEIECPNCTFQIKLSDLDVKSGEASCYQCQHTFQLDESIERRIRRKNTIYSPKSIEFEGSKESFDILVRVINLPKVLYKVIALIIACLSLLLIFLISRKVFNGYLFFAVVGILSLSSLLIQMKQFSKKISQKVQGNHTVLNISNFVQEENELIDKNVQLIPSEIQQFYVIQRTVNFKPMYILRVLLKNGSYKNVISTFSLQDALFVEQELEKFYDIKDERVSEEFNA